MSKSEKRYFKIKSAKEGSIYVQLFDRIVGQTTYNSVALKLWLEKEGIKSSLARVQHHLYQLVLKSLGEFQATKHPRYEVLSGIQQYMVLRDRGLHYQGRKILQAVLDTAEQYNYYGLTLEIYDLMEDWVTEEANYDEAFKQSKLLQVATERHQVYANSVVQLKGKIYELRHFFLKHNFARTAAQKTFLLQFSSKYERALVQEKNHLKQRLLLTILIYAYYGLQDYKELLLTEKKRLALLEEVAFKAHISPFLVYAYHRNLLWILLRNKDYEAHELLLQKIETTTYWKETFTADFYSIKLEIATKVTQLYACVEQGHYSPAYHQIKALWALHQKKTNYWDTNLLINTLILFINTTFCLGKYEETIDWLQLLEQEVPPAYLLPYRNMGKIAHLLIHDALGDVKYIQNVLESTRIRLYRKDDFFEVASLFLKFFKKKKNQSQAMEQVLLLEYKQKMEVLAQQEGQKGFFILFNFVDWFDSKLKKSTIANLNRRF